MDAPLPVPPSPRRPWALPGLVVLLLAVVGGWWTLRARESRAVSDALAPYAAVPLPDPGSPVDPALADLGARIFETRCAGCHAVQGEPHLGPNLAGVTRRRTYAWIQSMILAPDSMTRDDPVAAALRQGFGVQMMVPGGMDTLRTRAVIEFLRRADGGAGGES